MTEIQLDIPLPTILSISEKIEIQPTEILSIFEKYDKIFSIPQRAKDRILKTKVNVVSEDNLVEEVKKMVGIVDNPEDDNEKTDKEKEEEGAVLDVLGTNSQEVEEKHKRLLDTKLKHIKNFGGLYIKDDEGSGKILIKDSSKLDRKTILAHEGLHAGSEGFQSEDGKYHYLNEATVEILRIAGENQDGSPESLLKKVEDGSIEVSYIPHVRHLLAIMSATSMNESPVDVKRLAEYYFQNEDTNAIMLLMEISSKVSPKIEGAVSSIVEKLSK